MIRNRLRVVVSFGLARAVRIAAFALLWLPVLPASAAVRCEADDAFRTIAVEECEALMAIYEATGGASWAYVSGGNHPWDEDGPGCGLTSGTIRCSDEGGKDRHVVELNLKSVGMDGVLPGAPFENLPYLQKLDLSNNQLYGLIPTQLADLPALRTLILVNNELTGAIPNDLLGPGQPLAPVWPGISIDLTGNNLSGQLPLSLGRNDLAGLKVGSNPNLDGPIPHTYLSQSLNAFYYSQTQVCVPQDQEMLDWLDSISRHFGTRIPCEDEPPPPPPEPPQVPAALSASDGTSLTDITIEWTAAPDADFYYLERAAGSGSSVTWAELASNLPGADASYVDVIADSVPDARPGLAFQYRIKACKSDVGCSDYTPPDMGYTVLPSPSAGVADLFINACDWARIAPICGERTEPTCVVWDADDGDGGLHENATYYRVLVARDSTFYRSYVGNESQFDIAADHVPPDDCAAVDVTVLHGITAWQLAVQACNDFHCGIAELTTDPVPIQLIPVWKLLFD
ncbi:MAG: hypothetical protein KDI88_12025 [Gammaproteobacteria bacterium]|nr:hypothetical protein [Gammaproteobacteria bacterium]